MVLKFIAIVKEHKSLVAKVYETVLKARNSRAWGGPVAGSKTKSTHSVELTMVRQRARSLWGTRDKYGFQCAEYGLPDVRSKVRKVRIQLIETVFSKV